MFAHGRLTRFPQTVKVNATALEYRLPYRQATAVVRLEYRLDGSRGPGGGFFCGVEVAAGIVGLKASQNQSRAGHYG